MRESKSFKTIYADEGKRLLINGQLHDKIIVGLNNKPKLQEIEVPDFIGNASTVGEIKEILVAKSKENLTKYLKENPLLSTAKYPEGRYYNVTLEKQNLLLANISTYQMAVQSGLQCPLTWNDTGEECELWTFEQLFQLSIEIRNYVAPLTSLQQYMESNINACNSIIDLININVEFNKESIEGYMPIYLKKVGLNDEE